MHHGPAKALTLILAGGKGERLYPLTKNRTKPAVPFAGVYRIIDFTLSNCLHSGFNRIYVLVQYLSASLIQHIWRGWSVFPAVEASFLEVVPPQHRLADLWYRGTADAVFHNLNLLQEIRPRHVLILSGDHAYCMDYRPFLEAHEESGAGATVAGIKVPLREGHRFGILQVDRSGRITRFDEKPHRPEALPGDPAACLASMGIYIFETELLARALAEDARTPESRHDFGRDILPQLVREGVQVRAYDYSAHEPEPYWQDIGTIDAYFEASMDLLEEPPRLDLWNQRWPVRFCPCPEPPPLVGIGAACPAALLSPGVVLRACSVRRSILGPGVAVEQGAQVEESILLDGVRVGAGAVLRKCIVDSGIQIPREALIGIDPEQDRRLFTLSESGLTLVPTGLPPEEGFRVRPGAWR